MKKTKPRVRIKSTPTRLLAFVISIIVTTLVTSCLSSCSLSRTITNESQYIQRGDTSVIIQTKTIERYDGSKKMFN